MVLGGMGLLFILISWYWSFVVDDAFISFRYSENLAFGYGPTYNPGQWPHAEGYTSFSWVAIMTLPSFFGWDVLLMSKLLGICATLGMFGVSAKFVYELTSSFRPAVRQVCTGLLVLFLGAFYPVAVHAVSGMETALFAFLLTGFLYLTYRYVSSPTTAGAWLLGGCALLLGLTRPEGNLAAVVALAVAAAMVGGKHRRILLLGIALAYIAPGLIYFAWRFSYYGLLFPIPFYVKVGDQPLLAGWPAVQTFSKYLLYHIGLFLMLGCIRAGRALVAPMTAVAALLVFFIFPAAIMGFDWRYCFPLAPFFFVLAARGFGILLQWLEQVDMAGIRSPVSLASARRVILPALCIVTTLSLVDGAGASITDDGGYANIWNSRVIPLAKQLNTFSTTFSEHGVTSPLIALIDAGAIPYYTKWRTIDTYTLNDPVIAISRRDNPEYIVDYVLNSKPDLLVLISIDGEDFKPFIATEEPLYKAALKRGYNKAASLVIRGESSYYVSYYYWLMVPEMSPISAQLAQLDANWK